MCSTCPWTRTGACPSRQGTWSPPNRCACAVASPCARSDIQSTAAAGSRTPATTLISTRASPKAHPSEKGPSENPGRGPLHRPHARAADLRAEPGAQASHLFPIPEEHTERQRCCQFRSSHTPHTWHCRDVRQRSGNSTSQARLCGARGGSAAAAR